MKIHQLGMKELRNRLYSSKESTEDIFGDIVHQKLQPHSVVLNAGCGFRPDLHIRNKCEKVVGVDLDNRIYDNDDLDVATLGDIENITLPSGTFDLVVGQWVIEHLEDPIKCFRNLHRMLKDHGFVLLLTSNRYHYISLVAGVLPHWFNKRFYKFLGMEEEIYPVHYRCNTPSKLRNAMQQAGFETEELMLIEPEPGYLRFSTITFLIGILLERLLSTPAPKMLRRDMIGVFVKK